jgi:hypothetical protein
MNAMDLTRFGAVGPLRRRTVRLARLVSYPNRTPLIVSIKSIDWKHVFENDYHSPHATAAPP